jgi:hypothetical protein
MRSRFIAFFIHLAFSIIAIGGLVLAFTLYYYPAYFAVLENVYSAVLIVVPVDIIIGPVLTFIIYKPGKKGLAFDLKFIAACQVIASAYGLWTLYDQRPGYLVFYHDTFYSFPASIDQSKLRDDNLRVGPFDQPKIVAAELRGSVKEMFQQVQDSNAENIPIQAQSALFTNFTDYINTHPEFLKHAISLDKNNNTAVFHALAGGSLKTITLNSNSFQIISASHGE